MKKTQEAITILTLTACSYESPPFFIPEGGYRKDRKMRKGGKKRGRGKSR